MRKVLNQGQDLVLCNSLNKNNKTEDYSLNLNSKPDLPMNIKNSWNKKSNIQEKITPKNLKQPNTNKRLIITNRVQNSIKKNSYSLNMYLQSKDNQTLNKKLIRGHISSQNDRHKNHTPNASNTPRINKRYDAIESNKIYGNFTLYSK